MTEALDKINLAERTRHRNQSTWVALDWGGLLSPLEAQQEAMDTLSRAAVENFMAVSDENWGIKEYQRDKTVDLSQAEIDQERQIADAKVATGRVKLAIQKATDEYALAARVYDAKVKALVMGAREYAAQVEREQLAVEESRAVLAVAKEELHLDQVNAQIYYEAIQQAQVEVDIARAQVDVAKAHVRAAMAGIEAGQAEIQLIEAEVQQYVALADKATLQADVATIYAEILTKKLSEIRLDVGRQEIVAGFRYIQTRLDDALALWDTRQAMEAIRTEFETETQQEIGLSLVADKASEDLRETEVDNARTVFTYEEGQTASNIQEEKSLREGLVAARNALNDTRMNQSMQRDEKQTWAQALINAAQKYVHKHAQRQTTAITRTTEYISG